MDHFDDKEEDSSRHTLVIGAEGTAGSQPRPHPLPEPEIGRGTPLDRYVVLAPLGEGGMGKVYAAYDSVLDRKVALKLLPPGDPAVGSEATGGRARLLREAQAMARLSHPNVVAVYDVSQVGSQVFMAMEMVEGQTLHQWLQEKPRSWREVLSTFLEAGRRLAAAHAAGLVHRDFKPSNVMVGKDGRVRVTDFGLARPDRAPAEPEPPPAANEPARSHSLLELPLTQVGAVLGTPAYMAPEQFRGLTADARSDQFSFAVALWEALHGERPFDGKAPSERKENVLAGRLKPPPPHSKVPPWVLRVLLRALKTEPEARYPSLDALLADLERDPAQVRLKWLAAAAVLGIVTGALLIAYTLQQQHARLCTGSSQKLASIWDAPSQALVEKAFLATGKPYAQDTWERVREALRTYTGEWVAMHQDTCEATRIRGEQSESVMSLRMACLESRRQELSALVEVFSEADATVVEKAVSATSALRPLRHCADTEALLAEVKPPEDATTQAAVESLRVQLARVKALTEAGKYKEALELAAAITPKAGGLGYKPIHAEALYIQAWAQIVSGESKGVPPLLTEATWLAQASRHDAIAAASSTRLMGYYKFRGPPEEAERWSHYADAAIERLGEDSELRALYFNNIGLGLYLEGKPAEAHEAFERAFTLAQKHLGPGHATTLRYAANSLAALSDQKRVEETLPALEALVRLGETSLGPQHPFLTQPLMNLSYQYAEQGRLAEARLCLDRVLEIGRQSYRPHSEEWARYHIARGEFDMMEGHDAEALQHFEVAHGIFRDLSGPEGEDALLMQLKIAQAHVLLERLSQAWQLYQQTLELIGKAPKEQQDRLHATALLGLAHIHEVRGQHERALRTRQQAMELRIRAWGPEHSNTFLARLEVASSHLALKQVDRALALYEQAHGFFEKRLGPDYEPTLLALVGRGEALLKAGRSAEAIPVLELALQGIEKHVMRPEYQAHARLALAHALWDLGQDGARATRLATVALSTYSRTPLLHANELAELKALLKRHAPGLVTEPQPGSLAQTPAP